MTQPSPLFRAVSEQGDEFLALFAHRFDFIYAEHPQPQQKPAWKTECRYPLSDRLIDQGAFLYGVRFGTTTNYCMLDIDRDSPYHPQQDIWAIDRIQAALEPVGLVASVACTSSDSGGLHLYFPFDKPEKSWEVATGVNALLENAGFAVKPGQLEIFPNPKPYSTEAKLSLYNGHRLPLQMGSYLLNQDWQPIRSDRLIFLKHWEFAQSKNDIQPKTLKQILRQAKRTHYKISGKADKFLNDLNAEIAIGWTGFGQTNRLLGRIAMRAYVFNHVLSGGLPLTGKNLVEEIVRVAIELPGYQEWCRHQHEIEEKASEWARCVENSRYFPYGFQNDLAEGTGKQPTHEIDPEHQTKLESDRQSWNEQQQASARLRIQHAITDLLNQSQLPNQTTARFRALSRYGISGSSLYKHKDLWHPEHLLKSTQDPDVWTDMSLKERDIELDQDELDQQGDKTTHSSGTNYPNLLVDLACNGSLRLALVDRLVLPRLSLGCNPFVQLLGELAELGDGEVVASALGVGVGLGVVDGAVSEEGVVSGDGVSIELLPGFLGGAGLAAGLFGSDGEDVGGEDGDGDALLGLGLADGLGLVSGFVVDPPFQSRSDRPTAFSKFNDTS